MLDLQSRLIAANYIYIPPQTPPLVKEGLVANPWFATYGVGNAVDSVDRVDYGLVVYAARLKWQGLVANLWFATCGVGIVCILGIVGMLGIQSMLGPGGFIFMGDIWTLRYNFLTLC